MKKIGIDFGTTNTTLAFYDEKLKKSVGYKFGNTSEYISSAIAYHKERDNYYIANDAQSYRDDDNYYFYEYYKIGLIQSPSDVVINEHGKTYIEIAKDYLHRVISIYKEENLINDTILDVIVLAVPNVVFSASNKALKEALENFLKIESRIGMLMSEPECSTAYYCNNYESDFEGDIVVVDYGGGTLDTSLCRVNRTNNNGVSVPAISIIQQHSIDSSKLLTNGAGISFCVEMVKQITRLITENKNFYPTVYEFDTILASRENINRGLDEYYSNNEDEDFDSEISIRLCGENYVIRCSLFDGVFNKVNRPSLDDALNCILGDINDSKIAINDKHFKIMSVGGFSNLICVNKSITEKLGVGLNKIRTDNRIAKLTKLDKYYAIAYGAALYASSMVAKSTETTYQIEISTFDGTNVRRVILVDENKQVADYREPVWLKDSFYIIKGSTAVVQIIISSKSISNELPTTIDISDACIDDCNILIGVHLTEDNAFLCVYNLLTKTTDEVALGELITEFENRR